MDRMLSKNDIEEIVGCPLKVNISSNLKNNSSIAELFGSNNKALILYDYNKKGNTLIGHWCALLLNEDGLSFYDPYGKFIDEQLKHTPTEYKERTKQFKNELSRLFYHSPFKKLHYNPHDHQNIKKNYKTCGRHVALFLKNELEPEKYNELLKRASKQLGKNTNETVYKITEEFL